MTPEPACIIDEDRPCRACSAPGPLECPYRYLLGWDDDGPRAAGPAPARIDPPSGADFD